MIRSELVQKIADANPDLRLAEVEQIVDVFFEAIIDQLARGGASSCVALGHFPRARGLRARAAIRARASRWQWMQSASPISSPARKCATG